MTNTCTMQFQIKNHFSLYCVISLLDVGTLTLSRHILLDPIMLFFIMMSTYSELKFLSYQNR
jgi:dolichyl-phosphate-mannose-protein mannosyltransferase